MRFEFATSARIIFGNGTLAEVGPLAREFGRQALLVTGANPARAGKLRDLLARAGIAVVVCPIPGEPALEDVARGTASARDAGCELVIGFGGGSALDAAKAISALLTNGGDPLDYLEVIGRGQPLARAAAPCIAIPTTAGTGAEVTRNAVLGSPARGVKASLRSPLMIPRIALVDPELTHELPAAITASTGLDALTQLIEPYVSCRANPLTDALCLDGIGRAARSLRAAFHHGRDPAARSDMALASLFGGLALANAGLGAAHGFAAPIGGRFRAPHGAVCAALLPAVVELNLRALRARAPQAETLWRYEHVARLLTGNAHATADASVSWLRTLVTELGLPSLRAYGITAADSPALIEAAANASSMKANPLPLTREELAEILRLSL